MDRENVMGTRPIAGVMIRMAIPVIISMLLQACYNIVDSVFVSRMPDTAEIAGMGEYGVNALTLAFPLQMIIGAFGIGTGVGVNALVSRSLGEKNPEKAGKTAGNGMFLGLVFYLMFIAVGFFVVDFYTRSQTNDPVSISMCSSYLRINMFVSFGLIYFGIFEKLLQSTGKTIYSTIAQVCGALTNIVLDPIMIFGLLGFPALGIAGAAWATVIGQVVSMFDVSDHSAMLCVRALRIIGACMIFVGINMALQGVFQALNCGLSSLVVSLLRMLVIVLPLAYIFSRTSNPEWMIWFAIPIAEAVSAVVAILLAKKALMKK